MINNKNILIVEDDFISAESLKVLLEQEGYHIVGITDNASDALKLCQKYKPYVILMDIVINGQMSGAEAAVKIYEIYKNKNCKVIFLTAYSDKEMLEYAVEAHAYAYLKKPYRVDVILTTVKLAFITQEENRDKVDDNIVELRYGFSFNKKLRRLFKNGKEISLSKSTLKLIELLAKNKNISVSNEQICQYVWGESKHDGTLRSLIFRIRSALKNDLIINVNGIGYKIA